MPIQYFDDTHKRKASIPKANDSTHIDLMYIYVTVSMKLDHVCISLMNCQNATLLGLVELSMSTSNLGSIRCSLYMADAMVCCSESVCAKCTTANSVGNVAIRGDVPQILTHR